MDAAILDAPMSGEHWVMPTMDSNSTQQLLTDRPFPHIAQRVVMWALPIPMVLLNILVFVVAPRMKTLRRSTAYGMLSLATADFCLGLTHLMRMSYNAYSGYQLMEGHPLCIIDGYCQALFASISIATLAFMNLDRLLTLAFPLRYPRQLSKRGVISIHCGIWIFLIIFMIPGALGAFGTSVKYYENAFMCVPNWAGGFVYNLITLMIVNIIPTFIIGACFIGIFYFARTKNKALQNTASGTQVQVHRGGNAAKNKENAQWKRDLRIFKTLAIMTFGFYMAWTPYFVTVAIPELIVGKSLNSVTDFITPWLGASNSFWNPIIYIPAMRPFYCAMVQLYNDCTAVCCKSCRRKRFVTKGQKLTNAAVNSSSGSGGTNSTGLSNPSNSNEV